MKKVYNSKLIYNFCDKVQREQVQCMPEDIYHKTFWKKFNLNSIENVGLIFAYTDDKKALMQKFFPNKYAEISARGDFEITHFMYSKIDNKIHCIVNQDGERHLKLATDNYAERIPEEITNATKRIKKVIDGFYGYWIDGNSNDWYITDKNKQNGEYRKLQSYKNGRYEVNYLGWSYEDLYSIS